MARRRAPFVVRNFPKRGTIWGRSPADTGSTVLAASTAVLDSTAVSVAEGETIVRIRGMITIYSDQQAGTEDQVGAVGMLIASDQAVAVGVGSLPTPYTDQDSDLWMMHQYWAGAFVFADATGFSAQAAKSFPFDSKAMRKFGTGSTFCVIVENGAMVGVKYFLNYAVLFKVA